jgi:predicted SAM-dependent methyltransferase
MLQLHLGCGKRYIPGFVHVDLADYPHIDHRSDVSDLSMFNDGVADLIYASHVLEYFDRFEALDVLAEWRRVLKPGGVLRVAVPDFAALVEVYRRYGKLSMIIGPLYGRMEVAPGSQRFIYHRTVYDFQSLRETLEIAGFTNVRRYDWRQTVHKDHDDFSQAYIPHMDKENGLLISLNVEADKVR